MEICESLFKFFFVLFNAVFSIIGVLFLGVGIWVKVDKSNLFEMMRMIKLDNTAASFTNTSSSILDYSAIFLILLGLLTIFICFCGCFGAYYENHCLLYLYSYLVAAVIIGEIGIGIYSGIEEKRFERLLEKSSTFILQEDFNGILSTNTSLFTKLFTSIMFQMKCCGINNENDFNFTKQNWKQVINGTQQIHPIGCCKLNQTFHYDINLKLNLMIVESKMEDSLCPITQNTKLNKDGCIETLLNLIKNNLVFIISILVGVGVFEILCILFVCYIVQKRL